MTRGCMFLLIVVTGWTRLDAGEVGPSEGDIRSAVQRSIELIEQSTVQYREKRDCFSCHHQAMPTLMLTEAHRRGFQIDEEDLALQIERTAEHLQRGKERYQSGRGTGGQADTAGWGLWTLEVGAYEPDEITSAVTNYLLAYQSERGYWRTAGRRPPTEASHFTTTYVALRGLTRFGTDEQRETISQREEKALAWLLKAEPVDTEDRVYRLRSLYFLGAAKEVVEQAIKELIDTQRDDGGWAQTGEMESDAYATATALVTLFETGGLKTSDPQYQKGLQYLVKNQLNDGSWRVTTRSKPIQVYFESGYPHEKDQFISIAASSWASLALLLALPESTNARESSAESASSATAWPQFLGPNRNGVSSETDLFKTWPEGGPKEVWRVRGGVGMSGLAIQNGRLVTLVQKDDRQWALVLDSDTGETLHEIDVAPAYKNQMGDGPRATPAMADRVAYLFTGEGILAAADLQSGELVWKCDVIGELSGKPAEYGMAGSPLIVGDLVVVTTGTKQATVAAYDRKTGEPAWRAVAGDGDDTAGYSSPALLNVGGTSQIVAFEGKAAVGISLQTGELLWRFPYETDFDCNIATPIAHKGRLFISAGENHGCTLLKFEEAGESFQVEPVWTSFGRNSVMRNEWQTSILHGGHLYGFDNVGSAGPITNLNCVNIESGERVWQERRFGKGNLIAADGKLFISTMKGELVVVKTNPERFEELGRMKLITGTRQAPALSGGLLYLRDDREIVCIDVRRSPSSRADAN